MDTNGWSASIRRAFSGWRALALTAAVAFGVGGAVTTGAAELWSAPKKASDAKRIARENRQEISQLSRSVDELTRTVRIYICTRPELDWSTRIRLECGEFE